jgi:hypothetical protein
MTKITKFIPGCWFCGSIIKRLWKIQRYRRKTLSGMYCSFTCARDDSAGPIYYKSYPVLVGKMK